MTTEKEGVKESIWDAYNPKEYLRKLVQWEDDKRHQNKELYERKLIPDTDKFTKKVWRLRLKQLVASIMI